MAQDILNLNEESFELIIEVLSQLAPALRKDFDVAVKRITSLTGEWNDEDHRNFLESFKSIEVELGSIDDATAQMITEARRKLEMIQARRNIQL